MNDYFWQGGQKIAIEHANNAVTIDAENEAAALAAAERAGVAVENVVQVSPGLVRADVPRDRDSGMDRLREDNVVHHVYQAPGQPANEYLISDTFYIKFKAGTSPRSVEQYLRDEGLEVADDMGNGVLLVRVTDQTGRNCMKTANSAALRDDVEYAEPNLVHTLQKFAFIPADPLFPQQWHLHAPADGTELTAGSGIFAPEAWDTTRGTRDIVICVADDGFDLTHPDFQGDGKVVGRLNAKADGADGVSYDDDVMPKPGDYHGTPCAGVALAEQNGVGTVGVAPGCAFLAVRFPLSFKDNQMVKLFERISRDADVVSCSWGYGPANVPMSTTLKDTITSLTHTGGPRGKGLIVCVAAGNNNCPIRDHQNTKTYEYLDRFGIRRAYSGRIDRWIAAHPEVITVSGCTSLKTRSCYSSWGREISVCAPTDNWDDMRRFQPRGLGIVTTDNEGFGADSDFTPGSRYTSQFGGTSSATPTVAGVCGLILSRSPSLTALEVKRIIQSTADKDLNIKSETSVNEPGDFVDGFSLWFGHGKVNAARAVAAAVTPSEEVVVETSNPDAEIPDLGEPLVDEIEISDQGMISELRIGVDIRHTYIADLRVDVVSPDGTSVTLHNHTGGARNDLVTTFTAVEVPGLRAFHGRQIQGVWSLRVSDTWRMDVGALRSWRIVSKVAIPTPTTQTTATSHSRRRRQTTARTR